MALSRQPRRITPAAARMTEPPEDFVCDGCTAFPDRILTLRGWVDLLPACRWHDWHYHLLRTIGMSYWSRTEQREFKEWADLAFKMRVIYRLREKMTQRGSIALARTIWAAVDLLGGRAL